MVGVVRDVAGTIVACHRTYLHEFADGRVVKVSDAGVPRQIRHGNAKLSLAPVSGAAIRLGIDSEEIGVAEGIESAIGLSMFLQLPTWAAVSSSNMPNLVLPRHVRRIVIGPDLGDVKESGMKCAIGFRKRLVEEGKRQKRVIDIEIAYPRGAATDWAEWAELRAR